MSKNLRKQLLAVRDGRISFEEFVFRTRKDFHLLACKLLQRWTSPLWFTADDAAQELYLGAWKYIWEFDEMRGVPIERYVVFNAMSAAKRELHRVRGVTLAGSPDKKLSNFEAPLSSIGEEGDSDRLLSLLYEAPQAEEALITMQEKKMAATAVLKICKSPQERFAVLAIREAGSLDTAGDVLYEDFDHRIELRLNSEDHAARFVFRHASAVAKRMQEVPCQTGLTREV